MKAFVDKVALRAFRREVPAEVKAALLSIATGRTGATGLSDFLSAVLQSPSFLYREDRGTLDARTKMIKLDGYSIASRLSFWLLGAPPDDALLEAAASGTLDNADGVASQAQALLKRTEASSAWKTFSEQWLRLSGLDDIQTDAARFPAFDQSLKQAMHQEATKFIGEFLKPGADFGAAFTARHSYVNQSLATAIYRTEIEGSAKQALRPNEFSLVEFGEATSRGGLLSLPGVLAANGRDERVWPILRGKFVSESLLCSPPPPPPANVPALPEPKPNETQREQLERHRSSPACKACHEGLEPIGFGLEQFDLWGRFRSVDGNGQTLTGEGELAGWAEPRFRGARELGQRLAKSPVVAACFARQVFRFAMGRHELDTDACTLNALTKDFIAGKRDVATLVTSLVTAPAFRYAAQESP